MSEDLYRFFMDPAEKLENKKVVASKRFKDDKGRPVKWEVRPLSYQEISKLRKDCKTKQPVEDKNGRVVKILMFDGELFNLEYSVAATVFPDLKRKDLQDSYGVKGEKELLMKLLTPAELDDYNVMTQQAAGYMNADGEDTSAEKVDEAKNS
jgi:hypothetical protein